MKKILYSSQYIPPAWIEAHGLESVKIFPCSEGQLESEGEGICSYAELMRQNVLSTECEGVIFTTRCDQMRRISEICRLSGKKIFLMNIPSTWQNPVSLDIYKDELMRLSSFLTKISGATLSMGKLKKSINKLQEVNEVNKRGKNIALMGGPLVDKDSELIKIIERNSANIALDATELGGMSVPGINLKNLEKDHLAELANAYFANMPDIAKRPNTQFYEKAQQIIKERNIEGIIVRTYPWCDIWHAEIPRIKETFDLPMLNYTVDVNTLPTHDSRLKTRLCAFFEMI